MKKCFLFTSCYPYGFGETFLETEMPFLADRFDQIIIFSLTSNKTIVRKVPDNVLCFSLNQTNYPFKKIRKLFSGFFHNPFPIDRKKIKDRIHCYYKRGTVYRATRKCVSIIKKHNFTLDSNTVFYSYWLSDTALISLLLMVAPKNSSSNEKSHFVIDFPLFPVRFLR